MPPSTPVTSAKTVSSEAAQPPVQFAVLAHLLPIQRGAVQRARAVGYQPGRRFETIVTGEKLNWSFLELRSTAPGSGQFEDSAALGGAAVDETAKGILAALEGDAIELAGCARYEAVDGIAAIDAIRSELMQHRKLRVGKGGREREEARYDARVHARMTPQAM